LGTKVEVTNPKNNKKVIVTINDYMSDKAKDIIDLSYKAAVQIDLIRAGRLQVKIRALSHGDSSDSAVTKKIINGNQPAPKPTPQLR
jgi:rare lipoprotein A